MSTHRKQHWVPKSYLKAWCDPETPEGQEPYVWVFSPEGGTGKRRAPGNLFAESDLYTIAMPGGGRDLRLEHGLSQLENGFALLRERKLATYEELDQQEFLTLLAFVAACHARTPAQRDHWAKQWEKVRDLGRRLEAAVRSTPPEERRKFATLPGSGPSLTLAEVEQLAEDPLPPSLAASIEGQLPFLVQMHIAILEVQNEELSFLTSDAPCFFHDAKAATRPFPYNAVGLGFKTTEVFLPISPKQLLWFTWDGPDGYYYAKDTAVEQLNLMIRHYAKGAVVGNRPVTLSPLERDQRESPDESEDDSTVA